MNTQEIQGQWNKIRGKVKEKWGNLTEDDLQIHSGNVDQLIGKIQQKTGEGRDSIEKFLGDLTSKGASTIASATEAVRDFAQDLGPNMRDQYEQATQRLSEGYEQSRELIRNNPAQSVAVSFGVGAIVGLVVGLALRSR